jgi:hypothetical protein
MERSKVNKKPLHNPTTQIIDNQTSSHSLNITIFREFIAIAGIQFRLRQDDAEALYASIDSTD